MISPLTCLLSFGLSCSPLAAIAAHLQDATSAAEVSTAEVDSQAERELDAAMSAAVAPEMVAATASEVLLTVQKYYDATSDLQARFEQTYFNPAFGDQPTKTRGDLRLKKPGKMVWDYEGKAEPDFYADGKRLWVIEHDTRQVVSRSVDGDSEVAAAMKFLFGGQELLREFKVRFAAPARAERYGDAQHHEAGAVQVAHVLQEAVRLVPARRAPSSATATPLPIPGLATQVFGHQTHPPSRRRHLRGRRGLWRGIGRTCA